MTEPVSQETPPPADEPGFWAKLDQHIADSLGRLFDAGQATVAEGKGDPAKAAPAAGVGTEVRTAMAEVLAGERQRQEAEGKDQALLAKDAEIARLKSLVERPPEMERKIERWIGWRIE